MIGAPGEVRLGILGNGQLGRMLVQAASRFGVRSVVYSPVPGSPAGRLADVEVVGDYEDPDALDRFAGQVDVVTYEFENVPLASARRCQARVPVHPKPEVLEVAQDRLLEKGRLREAGFPVTPFARVDSAASLEEARAAMGGEVILKTHTAGYDGKGQQRVRADADLNEVWRRHGREVGIVERKMDFDLEVSVVSARGADQAVHAFPLLRNDHAHHILDVTSCPAGVSQKLEARALDVARGVLETLDVVGVLCVEMFALGDEVFINEIAPRPHNSGHLTIDAADHDQFEQQLRSVCGWPLFSPRVRPSAMANLLGDLWEGGPPPFTELLGEDGVHLHLYGKGAARPGRKMGHLTVVGDDGLSCRERVVALRERLRG
ncbi:MAG: 5-(carboxyamino)imidazole ribonucleotide synthase [Myxococcota bacterium]